MSKPHIKKKNGKWYLWRDRSVANWQIPVVIASSAKEAFENFVRYERFL